MLNFPYLLAEVDSKVVEIDDTCQAWCHGAPDVGVQVSHQRKLAEITVSGYFVLPDPADVNPPETGPLETLPLETSDNGVYSLLTLARGRAGEAGIAREFRDSAQLTQQLGGIYLHLTYDSRRGVFQAFHNISRKSSKLVGVTLEGAGPELILGRVLEFHIEIHRDHICLWIHDRFAGGDFLLKAIGPWTTEAWPETKIGSATGEPRLDESRLDESRLGPWGASPSGHWWVMCGLASDPTDRNPALPVGFGLSNLRVVLASETDEAVASLLYRGALDHLVTHPPKGVAEAEALKLIQHGKYLRDIATDLERIRLMLPIVEPPAAAATLEAAAAAAYKAAKKALRKKPCAKSPLSALTQPSPYSMKPAR